MSQNVPPKSAASRSARPALARLAGAVGAVLPPVAIALVALVVAAALAATAALVVLFSAGLVVVVALVVLGAGLLVRRRRTNPWVLVPVLALAIPAVAVAVSGERVAAQHGVEVRAPLTVAEIPTGEYRTGLGEQLVDLRGLDLPARSSTTVKARSDLDRTVVALPLKACWNLDVRWRTGRAWLPGISTPRWIEGLDPAGHYVDAWARRKRFDDWFPPVEGRIALFGRVRRESRGRRVSRVADPAAPTLRIELRSLGSAFAVRDYPDAVGPLRSTTWPLNLSPPASPAERRQAWASPRKSRRAAREWKAYGLEREAFARRSKALLDGGCGRKVVTG